MSLPTVDRDQPADPPPPKRRWPLGLLSLILVVVVVVGVLAFNGRSGGSTSAVPTLPSPGDTTPVVNPDLPGLAQNEPAPELSLQLTDGSQFVLSRHLEEDGRPVFLNFWASWCIPCRKEMPAIEASSKAHPDVMFLGVAVEDDSKAALEFAGEIGVTYPLAVDETDGLMGDYPYFGLPATFLISSEGRIIRSVFGGINESLIEALVLELAG